MRDNKYGVGFRFFNANVRKRRKTLQQEEPAVLGAINKIALVNQSMECHLPLCWSIAVVKCLPVVLENM